MPNVNRKPRTAPRRTTASTAKPTIQSWATDILLQAHAIAPCGEHGFMRLRFNHASVDYAHALAAHQPFPGLSKVKCISAVDDVLDSLSDNCPACD